MAKCRMVSDLIVRSENFLSMSYQAQLLYLQLLLDADDEGFVSGARRIAKLVGVKRSAIDELISKELLIFFDSSGVSVIRHWFIHNKLKASRIVRTIYTEESEKVCLNEKKIYVLRQKDGNSDDDGGPNGPSNNDQKESNNRDNLSQEDKIREDKIRQDKRRQDKTRQDKTKKERERESFSSLPNVATLDDLKRMTTLEINEKPKLTIEEYTKAFECIEKSHFAKTMFKRISTVHKHYNDIINGFYDNYKKPPKPKKSEPDKLIKQEYTEEELKGVFLDIDNVIIEELNI